LQTVIGGYLLVDASFLTGFWSFVTGLPIVALLDLNNTLIAGGLALSFILLSPVYFLANFIYVRSIEHNIRKIQNSRFALRLKKFKAVNTVIKKMDVIRNKTE